MVKAARAESLRPALENHLEDESRVERLKEVFGLIGGTAKAQHPGGLKGLIEEGSEVFEEGKELDDATADLALPGRGRTGDVMPLTAHRNLEEIFFEVYKPSLPKSPKRTIGNSWRTRDLKSDTTAANADRGG